MLLSEFDFPFDPSLIAGRPAEPRDAARLMMVPRNAARNRHHVVADLPFLLEPNDVLIVNDSKVIPARLRGFRRAGGVPVDILFIKEIEDGLWEALVKGGKPGQMIDFDKEISMTVLKSGPQHMIRVNSPRRFRDLLAVKGQMPLPPYIKRPPIEEDRTWYQTVYARTLGSIAAPTAGLHFTNELLTTLSHRGVKVCSITLHVGVATFRPVRTADVRCHRMGAESFEIPPETVAAVRRARLEAGRVVAVGTTVARALEATAGDDGNITASKGETDLFISPGYRFRAVNGLLTNFHLPRSTLLMLVSAFVGLERLRVAYEEAIRERYRFYSYGDAMLIL
jgi:S-adenosylmethionine:tRNA ribosyltransferase-isomerase